MQDNNVVESQFIKHVACIANEVGGYIPCDSSNGLALYKKEDLEENTIVDGYCWVCNQKFHPEQIAESSVAEEVGYVDGELKDLAKIKSKPKKQPMTKEEVVTFIKENGYESDNYRGIKDEYSKFFGHLTKKDYNGNIVARFYPETTEGVVTGYKSRIHPKQFGWMNKGRTGINSDLSGEVKFKTGGKYLLIVGGEEDKAAAFEMLREDQISRGQGDFEPIAVVSPTTGEGSAYKQVANRYEFCDQFDFIIIGQDNDEAGRESAKNIAKVLPPEKVKIASWSHKDPNNMLKLGKQKQFLREFYGAKEFVNSGIKSSIDAMEEVKEFLTAKKLPLPSHLHRVQEAHRGGLKSSGFIGNIIGDTSIGKSFLTDTLLNFWIPLPDVVPIIVSIERTAGEFTADLLSIHLKNNLTWYKEGQDAIDYLDNPEVQKLCREFLEDEYGRPSFYVIDERDGSLAVLQNKMQTAAAKYDSNLFIIDPLTDILRALGTEAQENHMMWQKQRKKDGWKILNVLHTRKPNPDKDGKIRKVTEYDALGSGTFVQSADFNWVINRDKMAENNVDRNTMELSLPKVRGGTTGVACNLYYDPATRQHYDREDWENGIVSRESSNTEGTKTIYNGEDIDDIL